MTAIGDPRLRSYDQLGLTGNPFVAESAPGVAEQVFTDVGLALPSQGAVVELVGCRGAGKTTHLCRWIGTGDYHHVELAWSRRRPPPLPAAGGIVAWDEADRLPRPVLAWRLSRARRRGGRVLLGTHQPTGLADQMLRLPPPTATAVRRFAALRIQAATPSGAPVLPLPAAHAERIAAASGGCWWQVGTLLHQWVGQVGEA